MIIVFFSISSQFSVHVVQFFEIKKKEITLILVGPIVRRDTNADRIIIPLKLKEAMLTLFDQKKTFNDFSVLKFSF